MWIIKEKKATEILPFDAIWRSQFNIQVTQNGNSIRKCTKSDVQTKTFRHHAYNLKVTVFGSLHLFYIHLRSTVLYYIWTLSSMENIRIQTHKETKNTIRPKKKALTLSSFWMCRSRNKERKQWKQRKRKKKITKKTQPIA